MDKSNEKRRKPMTLRRSMTVLKKRMPELAERFQVKSLGIFGSYVRNEQSRRSDLDILVEFEQPPDLLSLWIWKSISPNNWASRLTWCRGARSKAKLAREFCARWCAYEIRARAS